MLTIELTDLSISGWCKYFGLLSERVEKLLIVCFFYFKHVKYQLHGLMLCYDANLIITFCKLTTRNCLVEQRTSSIHDFSFQITHEKYFFLRSVEFQEFLTQSLDRLRVKVLIECTDCQPNS